MEQKIKSLKTAGKIISVIMKIGYIAMIVVMCICAASLIFLAVTDGQTSVDFGGTTIGIMDASISPAYVIVAVCIEYFIMSGFLFVIFLLAQRIFGEISVTGDPFTQKYVKYIRAIGILIAAMTIFTGIANTIISSFPSAIVVGTYTEAPGIVIGAIIFCLSYIIDYGCALKDRGVSEQ